MELGRGCSCNGTDFPLSLSVTNCSVIFETRINLRKDSRIYIYIYFLYNTRQICHNPYVAHFRHTHIALLLTFSKKIVIIAIFVILSSNGITRGNKSPRRSRLPRAPPPIHQDNRVNERLFCARRKILIRGKRKFERENEERRRESEWERRGKKRALETTFLYVSRDFFQLQTAPFASRLAAIIFKTRIFPSAPGHNEEGVGEGEEEEEERSTVGGRDNGGRYEEINPPPRPSAPHTAPLPTWSSVSMATALVQRTPARKQGGCEHSLLLWDSLHPRKGCDHPISTTYYAYGPNDFQKRLSLLESCAEGKLRYFADMLESRVWIFENSLNWFSGQTSAKARNFQEILVVYCESPLGQETSNKYDNFEV